MQFSTQIYTNCFVNSSQFISWTNWVNFVKFLDNFWISCQVMADMKKVYDDFTIINLYDLRHELQIWTQELIFFSLDCQLLKISFFSCHIYSKREEDILASLLSLIWNDNKKLWLIFGFTSQVDPMNRIFNLLYLNSTSSMTKLLSFNDIYTWSIFTFK